MFLKKIFGTSSQRKIKKILPLVNHINEYYESLRSKSDQELMERTKELKQYVGDARNKEKNRIETTKIPLKIGIMKNLKKLLFTTFPLEHLQIKYLNQQILSL